MDYIKRCSSNKYAKNVKLADLHENIKRCKSKSQTLELRYKRAIKYMTNYDNRIY